MRTFFSFFWSLLLVCLVTADPDYDESLVLEPLTPELLRASFNFRGNASLQSFEQQHFRFIPRSLGQILQHAKARELHLRFSTGRWDAESWGARPWRGQKEGGTGVELWAWVEADTEEESVYDLIISKRPVDAAAGHLLDGLPSTMLSRVYSALPLTSSTRHGRQGLSRRSSRPAIILNPRWKSFIYSMEHYPGKWYVRRI